MLKKGGNNLKYSELEKLIKKTCKIHREGANHTLWINEKTGKIFPVGRHKTQEIPKGTLKAILKDAGLE